MLKEDGSVVEEQYNIDAADIRSIEVIKVVRNVGQDQVHSLVAEASELMKSLPENVDERIYVDPETKVIRVSFDGRKLFSGWSSYETTPASSTT
ncbi:hypothetical protein, partial [Dokdonella immobilis]|uniref:hypothetical protein n=1 Tax=Dokdonella immobilis TaxID=578942 RepID=UPI001C3171DB